MSQNKPLKNISCRSAGTEQLSASEQIQQAKAAQKADAYRRATTEQQSGVALKPPMLYRPPKINVPTSMHEVARLINAELSKVATSQSFLLTLWEKYQEQQQTITELKAQVQQLQRDQ